MAGQSLSTFADKPYDIVIVGCGWAGLYMLHSARLHGFSAVALESGAGVGGTWYWNRYPGARVDTRSVSYSYSFSPELEQEWTWSELFAAQPEIEKYANRVVEKFGLGSDIHLNTKVLSAHFDERACEWAVRTSSGSLRGRFLVMATGGYSAPKKPEIPGLDEFAGDLYYTAKWPKDEVKFGRKRVGVIGTGASGAQVVTALGKKPVSNLYVFQRTPNFILPSWNGPADEEYTEIFKSQYRNFREEARVARTGSVYPDPLGYRPEIGSIGDIDDATATRRLWELWDCGSHVMMTSITDLFTSKTANERVAKFLRDRVRELVHDPETAELLCPREIYLGERRVILDTDYLSTFNNRRVHLVDIRADPISRIRTQGLVLSSGAEYDLDMLILATGFDSGTGALLGIDIRGRDNFSLREAWRDGPKSYLGLMVNRFPNLFMVAQIGSPGIRSQVLNSIEQHVEWLSELLTDVRRRGIHQVEATATSEERWTKHVAELAARSLQATHDTQYWGTNIPGKPRVYLSYLGGSNRYRQICDEVRHGDWIGIELRAGDGDIVRCTEEWDLPSAKPTEYIGGI